MMTFQEFINKSYEKGVKNEDKVDVLDVMTALGQDDIYVCRVEDEDGMKVRITDYPDDDDEDDEDEDDFDDVFEMDGDIGDSK